MHLLLWKYILDCLGNIVLVSSIEIDIGVQTIYFSPLWNALSGDFSRQIHSSVIFSSSKSNGILGPNFAFFSDFFGKTYFLYKNDSYGNILIFNSNDLSWKRVNKVWKPEDENYVKSAIKRQEKKATKTRKTISTIIKKNLVLSTDKRQENKSVMETSEIKNEVNSLQPKSGNSQLDNQDKTFRKDRLKNENNSNDSSVFNYKKRNKEESKQKIITRPDEWRSHSLIDEENGREILRNVREQRTRENNFRFLCAKNDSKLLYISEIADKNMEKYLSIWQFNIVSRKWGKGEPGKIFSAPGNIISVTCQTKLYQVIILFQRATSQANNFSKEIFRTAASEENENLMETKIKKPRKLDPQKSDKINSRKEGEFFLWKLTDSGSWISTKMPGKMSHILSSVSFLPSAFLSEGITLLKEYSSLPYKYQIISIKSGGGFIISKIFRISSPSLFSVMIDPEHFAAVYSERGCSVLRIQNIFEISKFVEENICPKLNLENSIVRLQNISFFNIRELRSVNRDLLPKKLKLFSIFVKGFENSSLIVPILTGSLTQEEFFPLRPKFSGPPPLLNNISSTLLLKNSSPTEELRGQSEQPDKPKNVNLYFQKQNKSKGNPDEEISSKINKTATKNMLDGSKNNGTHLMNGSQSSDSVLFFSLSITIFAFIGVGVFIRRCVRCPPPNISERAMPALDDAKPPSPICALYNNMSDSLQIPLSNCTFGKGGSAPNLNINGDFASVSSRECMTSPEFPYHSNILTPDTPNSCLTPNKNSQMLTRFPFTISSCENSPRSKFFPGDFLVTISDSLFGISPSKEYENNKRQMEPEESPSLYFPSPFNQSFTSSREFSSCSGDESPTKDLILSNSSSANEI